MKYIKKNLLLFLFLFGAISSNNITRVYAEDNFGFNIETANLSDSEKLSVYVQSDEAELKEIITGNVVSVAWGTELKVIDSDLFEKSKEEESSSIKIQSSQTITVHYRDEKTATDSLFDVKIADITDDKSLVFNPVFSEAYCVEQSNLYAYPSQSAPIVSKSAPAGEVLNVTAANETGFCKVQNESSDLFILEDNVSTSEKDIFTDVNETFYVKQNTTLFKDFALQNKNISVNLTKNQEVKVLARNKNGICKILVNEISGYIKESNLSAHKISSISDLQKSIANIAETDTGNVACVPNYCAAWVAGCYSKANPSMYSKPMGNAIDYWNKWGTNDGITSSTSSDNIPLGAVVVGSGSGDMGAYYGHVAIYIGNGKVAENIGYHNIVDFKDWCNAQVATCEGHTGYIGWVFPYNKDIQEY